MDALKRAEEAKRVAAGSEPQPTAAKPAVPTADAEGESRIAAPRAVPGGSGRDAASRMALIEEDLGEPVRRASGLRPAQPPAPDSAELERERELAQNLFSAKQAETRSNKPFHWAIGLGTTVAVAAIAGYFWYQLQPAPLSTAALAPAPQPSQAPAPAAAAAAQTPIRLAARAAAAIEPLPSSPSSDRAAAGDPPSVLSSPSRDAPQRAAEPSPVRISKSVARIDPGVSRAYKNFAAGNMAAAAADYASVLKIEPNNSDALHGMAAVSLRQGQTATAENYYRRALQADPKDASALAALIDLQAKGDPAEAETRLNVLVAEQPSSSGAHFALGNLYARQGRWREAQQAYFKALTGDGDNPDYHLNLAVSLDQLGQSALARQYYGSALATAQQRPGSFDPVAVAARLGELQQ